MVILLFQQLQTGINRKLYTRGEKSYCLHYVIITFFEKKSFVAQIEKWVTFQTMDATSAILLKPPQVCLLKPGGGQGGNGDLLNLQLDSLYRPEKT